MCQVRYDQSGRDFNMTPNDKIKGFTDCSSNNKLFYVCITNITIHNNFMNFNMIRNVAEQTSTTKKKTILELFATKLSARLQST